MDAIKQKETSKQTIYQKALHYRFLGHVFIGKTKKKKKLNTNI